MKLSVFNKKEKKKEPEPTEEQKDPAGLRKTFGGFQLRRPSVATFGSKSKSAAEESPKERPRAGSISAASTAILIRDKNYNPNPKRVSDLPKAVKVLYYFEMISL